MTDDHYASMTHQGGPTGLNIGEQTGTSVSLWCKPYYIAFIAKKRIETAKGISELVTWSNQGAPDQRLQSQ